MPNIQDALQPFVWGQGGQQLSPSDVARKRDVANALLNREGSSKNWGQGINRVAEALLYNKLTEDARVGEVSGRDAADDAFGGLFAEGAEPSLQDLTGVLGNDFANEGQQSVVNSLLQKRLNPDPRKYEEDPTGRNRYIDDGSLLFPDVETPVDPADPLTINNQIVDPESYEVLGDYRTPPKAPTLTSNQKEYLAAVEQGYEGTLQEWIISGREAGATNITNTVGGTTPGLGKLSTDFGYVLGPDGQPVIDPETGLPTASAIPGSPAAIKAAASAEGALEQEGVQTASDVLGAETMLDATNSVLDILDNSEGSPVTGTLSRPSALLSGTPAGRLRSYVGTLQSGVALGAMLRLKQASSTGATGFGAMNEKELGLLINAIGALDPDKTDPDIFRKTIQRIADQSKRVVEDIKKNVSTERIEELGLQPLIDSIDTQSLPEGTVIENDQGQQMVMRNGKWEPQI